MAKVARKPRPIVAFMRNASVGHPKRRTPAPIPDVHKGKVSGFVIFRRQLGFPLVKPRRASVERSMNRLRPQPCTAETERCRHAKDYTRDTPACCRAHIRTLVFEVGDFLTARGVTWWLDYGTLLGAVRNPMYGLEPGIIRHDKDADLGFLASDWEAVLRVDPGEGAWAAPPTVGGKPNMHRLAAGFEWVHKLSRTGNVRDIFTAGDSIKVRLSTTNHTNVDVFPWYISDGAVVQHGRTIPEGWFYRKRYVGVDRNKGREFPPERLLPLTTIRWEGRDLPAPADPEWMCAHRYGRGWKRPIRRNNDGQRR